MRMSRMMPPPRAVTMPRLTTPTRSSLACCTAVREPLRLKEKVPARSRASMRDASVAIGPCIAARVGRGGFRHQEAAPERVGPGRTSGAVVEHQPQRPPGAGADGADAVAHGGGGPAPGGGHGAVTGGEDDGLSLAQDRDMGPGLGSGPLLDHHELAPLVVDAGAVQAYDHLEREDVLAVQVAVQRIPVPGSVAQQERGGLGLAPAVADLEPLVEAVGPGA